MFTSYVVAFGNTLDAETAFTSIVVFQMVRTVMHGIPKYLNDLIGAYVSTTRIDSYLDQPQIQDLENRTNIDVMGDKLGFNSADLEWISPDSTNSTSVPTITGSDIDNQTAERTPLITQTSTNTQTAMHARHPVSQIPNQRNIERFSLKDIDVMFPLGQLSIVAGPTGSGKSSLLSALVGEMTLVRGSIMLPTINPSTLAANFPKYTDVIKLSNEGLAIHGIAYVAQEAWLRNATIRENILFGEPYDKKRYEEALYACALKQDLRNLVAGDMSEVGERGITLSGGQKQRLALARAVYSRCLGVLTVYFVITAAIPAFIIVAVFTTGIFVLIGFYYLNAFRELKRLESNSMSPLLSLFGEMIQGATTIRAFGIKHYYIKEAINRITAYNQPFYGVWTANRWLHLYVNVVSAAIASTATAFIYSNLDWIDAGMAGFILSYAIVFCDDMLWVVRNYSDNETNMNAIERIMQYMNVEQEAALDTEPEHKPLASWPTKGDVQIDNLFAEYVPGVPVLHGVSLSIEHGEKVGIVGRTGSGKTTISLALLRFVEARKGRIILDGVDISKIGLEDLRRNVTIIPQDPVLFNGSIRFNLDPFDEHPDSFLWEALRRTHLIKDEDSSSSNTETDGSGTNNSALDIKRMAGIFTSLDNEIKENGHNLSAGQRQLVALARALVRRSRLIVMDEATASVDFDTDSRIQTTIRGPEFANSTLLCIAHRLRTIIDYDRVLVLDDGRVAEFDTPHNLLQKEGGIFKRLCEESSEYEHMKDAAAASRN
ncbi:hypothetical protein EV177_003333 [Coemansia sp. RSA 1804]|nr:hypothetical protein EV177_003333 [Coemansia sp. RSA 1804]